MTARIDKQGAERFGGRALHALALAVLLVIAVADRCHASETAVGWQVEPQIYLAGMTTWLRNGQSSQSHAILATAAELKFQADAAPWHANLFVEYKYSRTERFTDIVSLGGYVRYNLTNWDTTTAIFFENNFGLVKQWVYAGRLRYRFAEHHKIGVQAAGTFEQALSPALFFGYYTTVSDSLSLNVIADPGINGGPDFAARIELVLQLH
jgi:hypothetical protein